MKNQSIITIILFVISINLISAKLLPQDLDITEYLKKIEAGERAEVVRIIPNVKRDFPGSPSLIYLDGLLTEDGEKAFQIYKSLVDKYPQSKYSDAAVYRIYTYFTAVDKQDKAEFYLKKLKTDYAGSPYLKLTERSVFTEIEGDLISTETNKTETGTKTKNNQKDFKFTVQAGAFTSKENALKLKAELDKSGYSAQVIQKTVGGTLFHIVRVGKFSEDEEAKKLSNMLNSKFKIQGWVVKLD